MDAAHDVIGRVLGAYPHPYVLASASLFSGEPLQLRGLQSIYAAVGNQPPYPWSLELLHDAALRASMQLFRA
ncbi:MAG: hypothetical protein HYX46_10775 [Betaproteobacteria bacterium]|nr:hypothetical protein [Betaproteobacteria bacterium]